MLRPLWSNAAACCLRHSTVRNTHRSREPYSHVCCILACWAERRDSKLRVRQSAKTGGPELAEWNGGVLRALYSLPDLCWSSFDGSVRTRWSGRARSNTFLAPDSLHLHQYSDSHNNTNFG